MNAREHPWTRMDTTSKKLVETHSVFSAETQKVSWGIGANWVETWLANFLS
jgi:hypothetical protein